MAARPGIEPVVPSGCRVNAMVVLRTSHRMRRDQHGHRARPDDPPRPEELSGFRTIRFRRRLFWGLFLAWMPACELLYPSFGQLVLIAWAIAWALAGTFYQLSRCPRCGQRCFRKAWTVRNPFDHRCSHCRVSLYWDRAHLGGFWRRLDEWYVVTYDGTGVNLDVSPPWRRPWKDSFSWSSVQRICFQGGGPHTSDRIYVFTSKRPESYPIPIEARGGQNVWAEIIRRGLFDADLALQAAGSGWGLLCWPQSDHLSGG